MVAARRLTCFVLGGQVWSLVGVLATPQQRHLDRWAADSPSRLCGAVARLLWLQGGAEVAVGLVKNKIQISNIVRVRFYTARARVVKYQYVSTNVIFLKI